MIELVSLAIAAMIFVMYLLERRDREIERRELFDLLAAKNAAELDRLRGAKAENAHETAHERAILKWKHKDGMNVLDKKE